MDQVRSGFFKPLAEIEFTRNRLPHWQQSGAAYFVTFRLHDSLPQDLLRTWHAEREAWLKRNPEPWPAEAQAEYRRLFPQRFDQWLDEGLGSSVLARPECAEVVETALRHFEGERSRLFSAVVMPNHVHAVVQVLPGWQLDALVHSWRRYSAREINRLRGGDGVLWGRDYFDRIVRDEEHFRRCVRYVRNNPAKAGLAAGRYRLFESEAARAVE